LISIQSSHGKTIGCQSCEELWTPNATHIELSLQGVEIIGNGSGSYHELRKLDQRLELMVNATRKCGGVYLYSNQRGCDGGRVYYDGCSMIVCNGQVLAQAEQFDVEDVQTITATIDLDDVKSYRASIPSLGVQTALMRQKDSLPTMLFCDDVTMVRRKRSDGTLPAVSQEIKLKYHSSEEECCMGPACWLWDYLRRSGASGFFLPLSGGADSSATATIVGCMCVLVCKTAGKHPTSQTAADCRRICGKEEDATWVPESPVVLANIIFHTSYMGTENSSEATESRAERLSATIGSKHYSIKIDVIVVAFLTLCLTYLGIKPKYQSQGGTNQEDIALQNIKLGCAWSFHTFSRNYFLL